MDRDELNEASRLFEDAARKLSAPDKDRNAALKKKDAKGGGVGREIDLHGKTLPESLAALETALRSRPETLRVVTGRGSHSEGIYSPLKIGIGEWLSDEGADKGYDYRWKDGAYEIWRRKR
jgi:DNA-nicking Smr family endonuclease